MGFFPHRSYDEILFDREEARREALERAQWFQDEEDLELAMKTVQAIAGALAPFGPGMGVDDSEWPDYGVVLEAWFTRDRLAALIEARPGVKEWLWEYHDGRAPGFLRPGESDTALTFKVTGAGKEGKVSVGYMRHRGELRHYMFYDDAPDAGAALAVLGLLPPEVKP
ncbi:MAG: hypothetical protein LBR80_01685 [Deltaproteobacteria bacterium]|jgi:hypothetical protein|nr:hypothetical protein [Deltaproteobacteria bacterium]